MTGRPRQRLAVGWYILVAGVVVPAAELASGLLGNPVWIGVTTFVLVAVAFAWFALAFFGTSWARARLRELLAGQENGMGFIGMMWSGLEPQEMVVVVAGESGFSIHDRSDAMFELAPDEIRSIRVDSSGATDDPLIVIALHDERIIRVCPMARFGLFRPSYSKTDRITENLNALRVGRAPHPAP
ncbi:hypothetical protein [Agromyces sp. NPDC058126]|uniref:hypothetical protein n=1 Tax=Agromyces sp. NPDC058126 TaxID=3346350 RepID=UPI0036DAED04